MHSTLLLVVDMQNAYMPNQPWECADIMDVVPKVEALCSNPNRGYDVLFTRFIADSNPVGTWKDYNRKYADVNASTYLNETIPNLLPYLDEFPVVDKSTYSCYKHEAVKRMVDSHETVALCGVVADCCVLSTALDIIDTGKPLVYLWDAVGEYRQGSGRAVLEVMRNMSLHVRTMSAEEYIRSF